MGLSKVGRLRMGRSPVAPVSSAGVYAVLLARNVRRLRLERGWTQAELARCVGLPPPDISHIERAIQNPTLRTLGRLADALVCELGDLCADETAAS
jgi:transcriptional regulator with XRE-family HTH domain